MFCLRVHEIMHKLWCVCSFEEFFHIQSQPDSITAVSLSSAHILPAFFLKKKKKIQTCSHVFLWPRLLSCSIAVCVLWRTVMSSRLCWKLLALAYFCINPFLLRRSSIHPALKSLKITAFLHHCFLFSFELTVREKFMSWDVHVCS